VVVVLDVVVVVVVVVVAAVVVEQKHNLIGRISMKSHFRASGIYTNIRLDT